MSGRLAEVRERLATTRQLDAVISAMRGIAAARAGEARGALPGIRECAATVRSAIASVIDPVSASVTVPGEQPAPTAPAKQARRSITIVLCTEQGFVGAFNSQAVHRACEVTTPGIGEYMVVGSHGVSIAQERGLDVSWSSPAAAHIGDIDRLAGALTDALYARLARQPDETVRIVHAVPDASRHLTFAVRQLLPFDFSRIEARTAGCAPILQLPVPRLLGGLVEAYVFTELCEAMMLSFAAENEARMQAMLAARSNVQQRIEHLTGEYQQLRQDEITSEIVELTAGVRSDDSTPTV